MKTNLTSSTIALYALCAGAFSLIAAGADLTQPIASGDLVFEEPDSQWPSSGQRWQTVQKRSWAWDSKQRTEQVHTGEPFKLFLDVDKAGEHEIMFSLREDGFEMDRFILARGQEFKPDGVGSAPKVKSGRLPPAFAIVK